MTRPNVVFLGCGAITAAHARTLRRMGAPARCFYASRGPERARRFERELGGAGSYGSYEAALADGRMDVAFVATPPPSHLELTLLALEQGKDVIVEKPAFLRSADFDTVEAAQARSGRRVLVAENYGYKPLARRLQAIVASGEIGELRFVHVNAVKRQAAPGWRGREDEAGGGALFEGGIHWIDLMAHLGPAVRAASGYRSGEAGLERSSVVVVQYEGGGVGTLHHSWEIPSPLRGLRLSHIYGTRGSVAFESNGLFVAVYGRRRRLMVPGLRDLTGHRAMFQDFLAALGSGREPLMTLARARRDLELVEAAHLNGNGKEAGA
jgi:UDP-N-acetylglucosamine 3-dehydrogenase